MAESNMKSLSSSDIPISALARPVQNIKHKAPRADQHDNAVTNVLIAIQQQIALLAEQNKMWIENMATVNRPAPVTGEQMQHLIDQVKDSSATNAQLRQEVQESTNGHSPASLLL